MLSIGVKTGGSRVRGLKFMKLGMLSWSGINMPWYKFFPIWGRFGYMLLTTSIIVFGREHPTFGDETISIIFPLIAFNKILMST